MGEITSTFISSSDIIVISYGFLDMIAFVVILATSGF